jgi:hypothetical protein
MPSGVFSLGLDMLTLQIFQSQAVPSSFQTPVKYREAKAKVDKSHENEI